MKRRPLRVFWLGLSLGLAAVAVSGHAAPFQNLGFDAVDAYSVSDTNFGSRLSWSQQLLPGWDFSGSMVAPGQNWRLSVDGPALPVYPIVYTTNTSAHIAPPSWPGFGSPQPLQIVVEGCNSLLTVSKQSMLIDLTSIAQTGDIPPDAKSLRFLNYGEGIDLYINGVFLPSVYLPRAGTDGPVSDVSADVSLFAGQTVELRFTTSRRPTTLPALYHGIDSVAFSSDKVAEAQLFTGVTEGAVVRDQGVFNTCAWADADNDGYVELFTGNQGATNGVVYRNAQDGTFNQLFFEAGQICTGAHWGDYNNDGFVDLMRTFDGTGGGIRLQINAGDDLDLTPPIEGSEGTVAANPSGADFDNDGWLDFLASKNTPTGGDGLFFYRNLGNLQFEEDKLVEAPAPFLLHYAPACADYDNDGRVDIFVAADGDQDLLLHNRGGGVFERETNSVFGLTPGRSVAAAWGDYDNDGFLDLVVVSRELLGNALFHNNGDGTFSRVTTASLGAQSGSSVNCAWGDYDNDGFLDLVIVNQGEPNALFHNNGDGSFTNVTPPEFLSAGTNSTAGAWADYDNDGQLDLFIANSQPGPITQNLLYRNNGSTNRGLKIRCFGTLSNGAAVGAKVRVQARVFGRVLWQMREISAGNGRSQNDLTASFGLGDARIADAVKVEWPSGLTQEIGNVAVNQLLIIHEPVLGFSNARVSQGQFNADVIGRAGLPKQVQTSPDLRQWTTIATFTNFTGHASFSTPIGNRLQQFFRAIE
jgi:hypothetical protein